MLHRSIAALAGALCVTAAAATPAFALPPVNDAFASAAPPPPMPVGGGSVRGLFSGTTVEATAQLGEPTHTLGSAPTESVWYAFTAPADRPMVVDTCRSPAFATALAVYTGATVDALTPVVSNEGSLECLSLGGSRVRFDATNGTAYRIAVDGMGDQEGAFELSLAFGAPSNDALGNALNVTTAFGTVTAAFDNLNATGEAGEPDHAGAGVPQSSIWFRYSPPQDAQVIVDTCETDFDTVLATYTGSDVGALQPVQSNDNSPDCASGVGSKLTGIVRAGTTSFLALDGVGGAEGHATIRFTSTPAPPAPKPTTVPAQPTPTAAQPTAGPTGSPAPRDTAAPEAALALRPQRLRDALRRGVRVRVRMSEAGRACVTLTMSPSTARRLGIRPTRSERARVALGSGCQTFTGPATRTVTIKLSARARRALARLARRRRSLTTTARTTGTDTAGNTATTSRSLLLRR
jgi:hypothetical protein